MIFWQTELHLPSYPRGFHLITDEIESALGQAPTVDVGLLHLMLHHTSASLTINENADPAVRRDFEVFFNRVAPDVHPGDGYEHTLEGPDDLPAHFKSSLLGSQLTLPITRGRLNLGTWQGIWLGEHRNRACSRTMVLTLHGE